MNDELLFYWTEDKLGHRLVMQKGTITFQSAALANRNASTQYQWEAILLDRWQRMAKGAKQLDGVYQIGPTAFQVAGTL